MKYYLSRHKKPVIAAVLAILPGSVSAIPLSECNGSVFDNRLAAACTTLLQGPFFSAESRAAEYYLRARAYLAMGRPDDAISDTTRAITIIEKSGVNTRLASDIRINGYAVRSKAHAEKAETDLAATDAAQSVALASQAVTNNPDLDNYNERAWAYYLMGDYPKALLDVAEALRLKSDDAHAIETRAEIYERQDNRDAAIADYRAVLALPYAGPRAKPDSRAGLARLGATP